MLVICRPRVHKEVHKESDVYVARIRIQGESYLSNSCLASGELSHGKNLGPTKKLVSKKPCGPWRGLIFEPFAGNFHMLCY
jgi:hypothetical protein